MESNHSLFFEQENGIKMERVIAFAKTILYGHSFKVVVNQFNVI
jgi:hypothetical protein